MLHLPGARLPEGKALLCVLIVLAFLVSLPLANAALTRVLSNVPGPRLHISSHPTAVAAVLRYLGFDKPGRPAVVLIGELNNTMYYCDCCANLHIWNIAEGTRKWAKLNGLLRELDIREGCRTSRRSKEPVSFATYRSHIDAGYPVVVSFSLDPERDQGLAEAAKAQQRFSCLGIGYTEGSDRSGRWEQKMYLQLPPGSLRAGHLDALRKYLSAIRGDRAEFDWNNSAMPNVVLTLISHKGR